MNGSLFEWISKSIFMLMVKNRRKNWSEFEGHLPYVFTFEKVNGKVGNEGKPDGTTT